MTAPSYNDHKRHWPDPLQRRVLLLAVATCKRLHFRCLATLQAYVHGERIWLCETSKGDTERVHDYNLC